jgi:membrane-associated phospholipid phosphatase
MSLDPWFSSWNYELFRILFRHIPHSKATDDWSEALISNPALSTWVFSFCFYRFWTKNDSQKLERRRHLVSSVIALSFAVLITLVLRPWIHWPAPVLNANFQTLFPQYLWGNGNENCFPSHSTLVYFTIAVGFWPLSRRLSISLAVLTLAFVSLPRVYEGGHYPIDVVFSCGLTILTLVAIWRWPIFTKVSNWLVESKRPANALQDLILFGWLFELAEGFHSIEFLAGVIHHAMLSR